MFVLVPFIVIIYQLSIKIDRSLTVIEILVKVIIIIIIDNN